MNLRRVLASILLAHAAFVAYQLVVNIDDLWQSSEAFLSPGNPFWFFWGLIAFNALVVIAAVVLSAYFMLAREVRLIYVLPLALVAALYGGYSLIIGVMALGLCLLGRHRPSST